MSHALLICDSGKIGTIKQAQALADALGCSHDLHEVSSGLSWLTAPWFKPSPPKKKVVCVISAGRRSAPVALALRRGSEFRSIPFIHIMDPGWPWRFGFDAVIAPTHDTLDGKKVISVLGALAKPPQPGAEVALHYQKHVDSQKPTLVLLVGGNTPNYQFAESAVQTWCNQLTSNLERTPMNVLVSFSRRTSSTVRELISEAAEKWGAYVWDETPPNPYPFFLDQGDVFLITQDSVSMVSEAATMGKPVFLLPLESKKSKFDSFYTELLTRGHATWYDGSLSIQDPKLRLNALEEAVSQLKAREIL